MSHVEKYDDVNVPLLAVVGFISVVLIFTSIVIAQTIYYNGNAITEQAKLKSRGPSRNETILAEQKAKLANYSWIERDKGVVGIPVQQSMQLLVKEFNETEKQKPVSADLTSEPKSESDKPAASKDEAAKQDNDQ